MEYVTPRDSNICLLSVADTSPSTNNHPSQHITLTYWNVITNWFDENGTVFQFNNKTDMILEVIQLTLLVVHIPNTHGLY